MKHNYTLEDLKTAEETVKKYEREVIELELKLVFTKNILNICNEYLEFVKNQPAHTEPEDKTLQTTLDSLEGAEIPPEFLDTVKPGQREKSALRGPRTRIPVEEWDKGMVLKCYTAFLEILEESSDGAPVQHIVEITGCDNTMNAYAAAFAILKNYPADYVYVERKPWPQTKRKLRGLMHRNRAAELGLKLIELNEDKEENENESKRPGETGD